MATVPPLVDHKKTVSALGLNCFSYENTVCSSGQGGPVGWCIRSADSHSGWAGVIVGTRQLKGAGRRNMHRKD